MKTTVRRLLFAATLVLAGFSFAQTAATQSASEYPTHAVKIIVPFSPAGPTDVVARIIAQKLSESLGKQFYVENIAHAGGNTGMGIAAKAPPDGYTILVHGSNFIVNPSLYATIPFDPYRDFAPVTLAGTMPNVIVVHPSVPARNVNELIALVKANPGKYNYAHPSTGTTPHLAGELFKLTFGLDLVTVPFNGAGPAVQSVVAGHTPIAFLALPPVASQIKSGNLRALVVLAKKRSAVIPDVPTMEESGISGQESDALTGVVVPAGTPREIIDLLYREIAKAFVQPDVKERLATLGFQPVANTPEDYAAYIRTEIPKWGKIIKTASIRID
ncbi:MAG TPA: tripartite tricarboxylate transporter substrate binding protein [Xanthobacteraceae bacterium]|jgi:tripartite-type tricarboxylate transporter receptor subunit TctC|nr:tripartite tricarboxylate transporter substrate binding protein [Xanthobacteraceae bacterium]